MIYNTVRITDVIDFSNGKQYWTASIETSNVERENTKTIPNGSGYYHFPVHKMSNKKALEKLRNIMAKEHTEEIERLTYSLQKLLDLDFEDK